MWEMKRASFIAVFSFLLSRKCLSLSQKSPLPPSPPPSISLAIFQKEERRGLRWGSGGEGVLKSKKKPYCICPFLPPYSSLPLFYCWVYCLGLKKPFSLFTATFPFVSRIYTAGASICYDSCSSLYFFCGEVKWARNCINQGSFFCPHS